MKYVIASLVVTMAVATALGLSGCASNDKPLDAATKQSADRLAEIIKSSGGEWEKVSPEDRDYLIKTFGSEHSAKILIAQPPGARGAGGVGGGPTGMPKGPGKSSSTNE